MDHVDWLKTGLRQPGKTQKGLADALGIDASAVSRMLKGGRKLQLYEEAKAAAYLGINPPGRTLIPNQSVAFAQHTTESVPLRNIAAGGVWREEGVPMAFEAVAIPVVPEPRLAGVKQYATRIDGTDFNKHLRPGDFAIFVPFRDLRSEPKDRDIVEVKRYRGSLEETTVRRVHIKADTIELWPESDDPAWQYPSASAAPLRLGNGPKSERIEITGLFVGLYRPHTF